MSSLWGNTNRKTIMLYKNQDVDTLLANETERRRNLPHNRRGGISLFLVLIISGICLFGGYMYGQKTSINNLPDEKVSTWDEDHSSLFEVGETVSFKGYNELAVVLSKKWNKITRNWYYHVRLIETNRKTTVTSRHLSRLNHD